LKRLSHTCPLDYWLRGLYKGKMTARKVWFQANTESYFSYKRTLNNFWILEKAHHSSPSLPSPLVLLILEYLLAIGAYAELLDGRVLPGAPRAVSLAAIVAAGQLLLGELLPADVALGHVFPLRISFFAYKSPRHKAHTRWKERRNLIIRRFIGRPHIRQR